jgi:hypothetical protein
VAHERRISPCSRFSACGYCSTLSSKGCSRLASMMRHPFVSILPLCGKFSRLTIYLFISVTSWGRWAASRLTTIHFVSPARKLKLGGADDYRDDCKRPAKALHWGKSRAATHRQGLQAQGVKAQGLQDWPWMHSKQRIVPSPARSR